MPAKTKYRSNKLASHLHLNRCPWVLKPLALLIACTSGLALANPLIADETGNIYIADSGTVTPPSATASNVRVFAVDNSGSTGQVTGVSVEAYQGNPFTVVYAQDNSGTPLTSFGGLTGASNETANVLVYDGGLASTGSQNTYVQLNAGATNLTVDGTGVYVNGTAIGAPPDLSGYAQLSGATFSGAVSVTATTGGNALTATGADGINTLTALDNSVTATTGRNTIQANTGNTLVTATGNNAITATTGSNTSNANAANQANSLNANGADGSNLVSATGLKGINHIIANATTGINNVEAKTNNIGVTTANSINTIGNTNTGTFVSSYAGAGYTTLNNTNATLGTGTGGMVQTSAATATVRASSAGTLASNGSSGDMNVGAGGGYTAYGTSQSTGTGTIGGIVDNKPYTNKISGNTYVDGNVYINGTLNYVSSNSANTSVIGATSATSNLAGATTATKGGTAIVLKGATGTQTVVDANGKLTNVTGTAAQSTAAITLTNGRGNTHGLVITETQASLSGGVNSSTLTMNDNGANFSDAATGAPVQVHGVNDGTSNFDAVNVRQFSGAIASVTAMANIPQVNQDKTYALGVGLGNFMGKTALALGGTYRFTRNGVLKGSISSDMSSSNTTTVGVGAAWSY